MLYAPIFLLPAPLALPATLHPTHTIPGGARRLIWDEPTATLAAPMALGGIMFLTLDGPRIASEHWHPRWTSLNALPLGDRRWLLADRGGFLRLVEFDDSLGDFREVATWTHDGVPTDIAWRDGLLYVAAGGAGVRVHDWDGLSAPRLRARFPFVDFSKEFAFLSSSTFALADNLDTGVQVLTMKDAERPFLLYRESHGFVDGVDIFGEKLAITARNVGTLLYDVGDPANPALLATLPLKLGPVESQARFSAFSPAGELLVCHDGEGAALFVIEDTATGINPRERFRLSGDASPYLSGTFLPDGLIVLCTLEGRLHFVEP